ncbi:aldolase [Favolaschia claudopus]|uniref:Aldolase n=1 Tax=Favolaschia claudopus TaxID=2862362 RepID=A0AAW0DVJ5_9AGAR
MSSTNATLLTQVRGLVTVDVDSMDPDVASRHSKAQKFCDMTSNQAIVYGQAPLSANKPLLESAIAHARNKTQLTELQVDSQEFEQDVVDVFTVLLAKQIYPYLTGNVHAQTSPSAAYDTEKTIQHAKKLVSLFAENGIPSNRVCIKIPATPESLLACRELQASGIQTLATCLFSLPQALAASQANCTYVAPYFNELRVHFQPGVWVDYADPKSEHPMSSVILDIVHAFRHIGSQTKVMPASIVTTNEICSLKSIQVIALVSLRPDHLTLSGSVLDALDASPTVSSELFAPPLAPPTSKSLNKDYLVDDGASLREAFAADEVVQRKLTDALSIFDEKEAETRKLVKALVAGKILPKIYIKFTMR